MAELFNYSISHIIESAGFYKLFKPDKTAQYVGVSCCIQDEYNYKPII